MGGSASASGGNEKSSESMDSRQAGQKMASSRGTSEHNGDSKWPQKVSIPTKVTIDKEQPHLEAQEILAGDCHVILRTKRGNAGSSG